MTLDRLVWSYDGSAQDGPERRVRQEANAQFRLLNPRLAAGWQPPGSRSRGAISMIVKGLGSSFDRNWRS